MPIRDVLELLMIAYMIYFKDSKTRDISEVNEFDDLEILSNMHASYSAVSYKGNEEMI
jgi:hypothetical protein